MAFPVSNATFLPPVIVATEAIWIFCKKVFLTLYVLEFSEYSPLISCRKENNKLKTTAKKITVIDKFFLSSNNFFS